MDILDQIDHAIDDYGMSPDAMRQAPHLDSNALDAAYRATAAGQMQALHDECAQFWAAVEPVLRRAAEAMRMWSVRVPVERWVAPDTGGVYYAPYGTPPPASAGDLGPAWVLVGQLPTDGVAAAHPLDRVRAQQARGQRGAGPPPQQRAPRRIDPRGTTR